MRLLASNYDLKFFPESDDCRVVGVPRFNYPTNNNRVAPRNLVLVNLNFSYGVFEEASLDWLDDIKFVLRKLGKDFIISRHHRDKTPVAEGIVSKDKLHSDLARTGIVISRFSTVIIEALLMNKKVIYYNPHGEMVDKFEDSMGAYLVAKNRSELFDHLKTWSNNDVCPEKIQDFLKLHLTVRSKEESLDRISVALREFLSVGVISTKGFRLRNFFMFKKPDFSCFCWQGFSWFLFLGLVQ